MAAISSNATLGYKFLLEGNPLLWRPHIRPHLVQPPLSVTVHNFQGPPLAIACGVLISVPTVQIGKMRTQ